MPKNVFYVGNALCFDTRMLSNAVYIGSSPSFEAMMPKNAVYIGNSIIFETMMPKMLCRKLTAYLVLSIENAIY